MVTGYPATGVLTQQRWRNIAGCCLWMERTSRLGRRQSPKRTVLCDELVHAVRCQNAILDGEIASAPDGRSQFNSLLFRREWPYFLAFDLL